MEDIYTRIWNLAKPYYQRSRPMDVAHIVWMMDAGLGVCNCEELDDTLLMPLIILHDVGYSAVSQGNVFNQSIRKAHMVEGARIAQTILEAVGYPVDKIANVVHNISIHDNWAFGDNEIYKGDIILGAFNDLDFAWMATKVGFSAIAKIRGLDHVAMIEFLESNEKLINRPFQSTTVARMFENYLVDRRKEFQC